MARISLMSRHDFRYGLFSLIANFQNSVTKLSNTSMDHRFRKDLKDLNVSTAFIAYHPSTDASKCLSIFDAFLRSSIFQSLKYFGACHAVNL